MDFLKDVFGTEALTYDQLAEKLKDTKDIKVGNLAGGAYVSKEKFSSLETERDGLKTQLETAAGEIKSYKDLDVDGIKQKAADWETKYNTDTQNLKEQLEAANYGFAVQQAVSGVKFTSESAKKAFIADLTAKKLPLQEGKLLGLEDFRKQRWRLSERGMRLMVSILCKRTIHAVLADSKRRRPNRVPASPAGAKGQGDTEAFG